MGPLSEVGRIEELVLKHPYDAFGGPEQIAQQWQDVNFTAPPDFTEAMHEYDALLAMLIDVLETDPRLLPPAPETGLDSIYVRDAAVVSPGGMILASMGKPQRSAEPEAQRQAFQRWNLPIAGAIRPPGHLEGGDVVWLDSRTVCIGLGYRTNAAGIDQFRRLLGPGITCQVVPLPHWRGPADVFHLMSVLSPVDHNLAVVYSPLMPVSFRQWLLDRDYRLVEVPDDEFDSMGANVLAVAPRRCVMLSGNPNTRSRLERAGADVRVYAGREISLKGGGGPTCLTRPIRRAAS